MNQRLKAFTLIEVLIALAILAIALSAVSLAMLENVHASRHFRDVFAAHSVALNAIARMQMGLIASPTETEPQTDTERMLNKNWEWTASVDQKSNGYYKRIRVEVTQKGIAKNIEKIIGFLKVND